MIRGVHDEGQVHSEGLNIHTAREHEAILHVNLDALITNQSFLMNIHEHLT